MGRLSYLAAHALPIFLWLCWTADLIKSASSHFTIMCCWCPLPTAKVNHFLLPLYINCLIIYGMIFPFMQRLPHFLKSILEIQEDQISYILDCTFKHFQEIYEMWLPLQKTTLILWSVSLIYTCAKSSTGSANLPLQEQQTHWSSFLNLPWNPF